jgi:hypothetical protein
MADPDQVIARADEQMRRLAIGGTAQKARTRRRQRSVARTGQRVARALMVGFAIVLGLVLWGLIIGPVGTTVLVLAVLFGGMAMMAGAISVSDTPEPRALGDTAPAELPAATEAWLDRQRRELPRLAAPQVDAITVKLATLETQLERIPAHDPVAQDLSRLLSKHLPELVESYTRVPAEQRKRTIDSSGKTLDTTLIDGLKAVEMELTRASDALAEADRTALVVQGKFLEARYKGDEPV